MSPRSSRIKDRASSFENRVHGVQASRDRWRSIQSEKRHQMAQLRPDRPHVSYRKSPSGPKHTPHTHPHGVELGPHSDKPSPIRFRPTIHMYGIRKMSY